MQPSDKSRVPNSRKAMSPNGPSALRWHRWFHPGKNGETSQLNRLKKCWKREWFVWLICGWYSYMSTDLKNRILAHQQSKTATCFSSNIIWHGEGSACLQNGEVNSGGRIWHVDRPSRKGSPNQYVFLCSSDIICQVRYRNLGNRNLKIDWN